MLLLMAVASYGQAFAQSASGVVGKPCPYNCRIVGLGMSECRDWRQGDTCYVQVIKPGQRADSAQPTPWHATESKPFGSAKPIGPPIKVDPKANQILSQSGPSGSIKSQLTKCREMERSGIAPPYINIYSREHSRTSSASKIDLVGSFEGICLVEAGYFEFGRKVRSLRVVPLTDLNRFEFRVSADRDRSAEIRVYNINGEREIYPVN